MIQRFKFPSIILIVLGNIGTSWAHDPVFSPGPHVLFKKGVEIHTIVNTDKQGDAKIKQQTLAVKYGITGDWVVGFEVPNKNISNNNVTNSGIADVVLSTKYRFYRNDSLGKQHSAAVFARIKLDTSNSPTATQTTDTLLGLTYGYESLKWYRWASVRYRYNQNLENLQRGNRLFVDVAGGYRHKVNDYRKPDTVYLVELNGELLGQNQFNGTEVINSGGNQWFASPGVMWTLRNFAIKAGVQIPIISNLKGNQQSTDYRAFLEFELHL